MKIGQARRQAATIVEQLGTRTAIEGAYFIGSMVTAPEDAELPPTSDLDVMVVVPADAPKVGKVERGDALIEVSFIAKHVLTADTVLADYHVANGLRHNGILLDPTGWLTELQQRVAASFTDARHVRLRRDNAKLKIENRLTAIDRDAPWHDQVITWLFPTGVAAHVLLVAALKNPTVKNRYRAVREVLDTYGHNEYYDELLDLLGCRTLTPETVTRHIGRVASVFDQAATVGTTPLAFSSDITAASRPLIIESSTRLVAQGDHREAVFWLVATAARCATVMAADGTPDQLAEARDCLRDLLADLGIGGPDDLYSRAGRDVAGLPRLTEVSEQIITANPEIE